MNVLGSSSHPEPTRVFAPLSLVVGKLGLTAHPGSPAAGPCHAFNATIRGWAPEVARGRKGHRALVNGLTFDAASMASRPGHHHQNHIAPERSALVLSRRWRSASVAVDKGECGMRTLSWKLLTPHAVVVCGPSQQVTDASVEDSLAPGAGGSVGLVNVRVLPMSGAKRVVPGQTVLVMDGVIHSLGPASSIEIPADVPVVDGKGGFLIPGLVDSHVHLFGAGDNELYVANGVTTVFSMGSAGGAVLDWRHDVSEGRLLGPQIFTSSNWLDGDPPARSVNTIVATPEEGRQLVGELAEQGYDFVKAYTFLDDPTYRAIAEEARSRGIALVGHVPRQVGLQPVLEEGQALIAHIEELLATEFRESLDAGRAAEVAAQLAARGVAVSPTLGVLEQIALQTGNRDAVEELWARSVTRYVPSVREAWWRTENPYAANEQPSWRTLMQEWLRFGREFTRLLHQHRVLILAGTDAPVPQMVPGFSLLDDLRNLHKAGLTPYEVLKTATANPAAFIGPTANFGRIEVGLRGDLVLLEGDPLESLDALAKPAGVGLNGVWFDRAELDGLLDLVAARVVAAAAN